MFAEDVTPFFYTESDGQLVGIDPSLAEDIARHLGVVVRYNRSATTFDEVVDEVVAGRADIAVSLLSDTLDRATRVDFSEPYVSVRQFLLINRLELGQLLAGNQDLPIVELLNDRTSRIGVIGGTSYVDFVEQYFSRAEKVEYEFWADMLNDLKAGALVALMYDEIEIGNWRLADPAGALDLRPFHLEGRPDTIAIATRRGDNDLRDWIDLYLRKIREDGSLDLLLAKYLYTTERALGDD